MEDDCYYYAAFAMSEALLGLVLPVLSLFRTYNSEELYCPSLLTA